MLGLSRLMTGRNGGAGVSSDPSRRFSVGPDVIADPLTHRIIRGGRAISVEPRVMQLLGYFTERAGQVISKDELRQQVWQAHVVDEAIHRAVSLLRSAVGDTPRDSRIIETLPRHGYRLLVTPAPVTEGRWSKRRPAAIAAAGVAIAAGSAILASVIARPDLSAPLPGPAPAPYSTPAAEPLAPPKGGAAVAPRARTVAKTARPSPTPSALRAASPEAAVAPPAPAPAASAQERAPAPSQAPVAPKPGG